MKNNRKSTPDILNNLMGGMTIEQESMQAIQPVNNKTIMQDIDELTTPALSGRSLLKAKTDNHKTIKPENMNAVKTVMPEARKEKTTFNLSESVLIELEDAWIKLRRKIGKGEQRITKTLIVEKAIKIALHDLESRSELSDIFVELKS
jgi:hypothetical protein